MGIDVGLGHFATLVQDHGMVARIPTPKSLLRSLRLLWRRQSEWCSEQQKGSKSRKKSALRLTRLRRLTTRLSKTRAVIVVEDLNVSELLKNPKLARHSADMGWGELRRRLAYKCPWCGSRLMEANRYFPSSKTYSCCGQALESLPWTCGSRSAPGVVCTMTGT